MVLEEVRGHELTLPKPRRTISDGEGVVVWSSEEGIYDISKTVPHTVVGQATLSSLEEWKGQKFPGDAQDAQTIYRWMPIESSCPFLCLYPNFVIKDEMSPKE